MVFSPKWNKAGMHYGFPDNLLFRAALRGKTPSAAKKLQHVCFDAGQQLWQADDTSPYAFFPLRGAVSLQVSPEEGKHVEIAVVGREGFAGVGLVTASQRAFSAAVAISAGEAIVMDRSAFQRHMAVPAFHAAVDRYTRLFMTMVAHTLVCTRIHVIEKLCIGRLLSIQDRIDGVTLRLTQEAFARHLGVRRATVSRAVAGLQKAGAIVYDRRGRVTILDRRHLERLACSCYHTIKSDFDEHVDRQGGL